MGILKRLEFRLIQAERSLLVAMILFMVALSFLQVVLRTVFSTGILWGDTLGRHLVLWVGFLGAGLAASAERQFAMDLSARLFSGRTKAAIQFACHLFTLVICGLMIRASAEFFREEYAQHAALFTVGRLTARAWVFELILPGGFALLLVHYLIKLVEAAGTLVRGTERE